ncbi:sugar phosphate isomerase/epimerase family protein [Frondihabitans australicus]|uniref:Sugar phosphate isomerase/epimerase n=1 Tax=Frondihabitans australicus TaxID=386892 RepID=A0A495IKP7_9MICO|nr:sugar phosphate isomerase/epimerase family protein [Frondihabitans australicus]RKR76547.1 sugar phosphate isomerase/epimerase [Frondihabitans australicus]
MRYTPETWPIAAAMLQFPAVLPDGTLAQDADALEWVDTFSRIAETGFTDVEINDNWVRIGDLPSARVDELAAAAREAGTEPSSVCVVRSSIIDPVTGAENLDYTHRTVEATKQLGAEVLSIGFHRPLTAEQRQRLWFWTTQGEIDAPDDEENFALAVKRVREVGEHAASLGLELTLEMYEDTYLGTAASSVRLVTEVGLSNVGLNPDVGNLIRLHRPIDDWQETLAATLPHANYWHVKNYTRDEDPAQGLYTASPAPLELGLINYRHAVRDAISLGFEGRFVCEHYGGDGLGVSAINREYLRRALASAEGTERRRAVASGQGAGAAEPSPATASPAVTA